MAALLAANPSRTSAEKFPSLPKTRSALRDADNNQDALSLPAAVLAAQKSHQARRRYARAARVSDRIDRTDAGIGAGSVLSLIGLGAALCVVHRKHRVPGSHPVTRR